MLLLTITCIFVHSAGEFEFGTNTEQADLRYIFNHKLSSQRSECLTQNNNNFKPYSVLFISNIKFPLHCNFHLHSTITFTVAVAGVSTPLLAVH